LGVFLISLRAPKTPAREILRLHSQTHFAQDDIKCLR
jgi:hypothetical protein